ncbi:exodeoxyribonuclease V subunit gamma [Catenovulum agarivorans]|uniref:exodeoxyribonuclease V subunit gamma n=1 Tax=Catenovulum agarivorans TaxID=1172192 RepID=UPI0012F8B6A1|nr:exodeoxyribonuclease V subunit gamma [Catenovulum agarivorans]
MLTLYPSNKLEDLVILLNKVMQYRQTSVLSQDIILVESQGMQHWLNMQLSQMTKIAMNITYPMPSRFIWDTARKVLGSDKIPRQSPYSREILTFRIEQIFHSDEWLTSAASELVTQYWQEQRSNQQQIGNRQGQQQLKAFQLAQAVADVFEQYMLYRPDWLENWQDGKLNTEQTDEIWQQQLWLILFKQSPYHPVALQNEMLKELEHKHHLLPKDIHIFGINTMPPKTLEFFEVISNWVNIHLYHLNPCVDYWGDLQSEKTTVKKQLKQLKLNTLEQWLEQENISQPLLANLGQQGKGFFSSLQKLNGFEINAFDLAKEQEEAAEQTNNNSMTLSCLQQVQQDILLLTDATQANAEINQDKQTSLIDDSINIVSCHNALREIEALHDFLLAEFEANPELTPRDVIVMCPAIEDYAPYIHSVFRSSRQPQVEGEQLRLPCTIADRNQLDSQPIISTFLELLELPDSRFEVSKILDYLRLPALQNKFNLDETQIEIIEWWLKQANVHWGRDQTHKQQITGNQAADAIYTWQWAIERLLSGYAYSSEPTFSDDLAYMPHVEGQNALVLGQLCDLLTQLQYHAQQLNQARSAEEWHSYLTKMLESFFAIDEQAQEQESLLIIQNAINSLTERSAKADYQQDISLEVIRFYLQHQFSQADTSSQFLTGQITFCSMVPMRSIPFKVIAILGLNDGVYPRQQTPISFDLTQYSEYRLGDRSRRSDDRYLFLEALISARDKLYLSYQGRDVKNNSVREPSLILKELMNYLALGYAWDFTAANSQLRQMPLHAFSPDNFKTFKSFAKQWQRLAFANKQQASKNTWVSNSKSDSDVTSDSSQQASIDLRQLVNMFVDPFSFYCRCKLGLELNLNTVDDLDVEPFELNTLLDYQLTDSINSSLINETKVLDKNSKDSSNTGSAAELITCKVVKEYRLQGALPESMVSEQQIEQTCVKARALHQALAAFLPLEQVGINLGLQNIELTAAVVQSNSTNLSGYLLSRPTSKKAKDDILHWLSYLLVSCYQQQMQNTYAVFTQGKGEDLTIQISGYLHNASFGLVQAKQLLAHYLAVYQSQFEQTRIISIELMQPIFASVAKSKKLNITDIEAIKQDVTLFKKWCESVEELWSSNEHFQWLYPDFNQLTEQLEYDYHTSVELFQPIYAQLVNEVTV